VISRQTARILPVHGAYGNEALLRRKSLSGPAII
jgi:hypothetical protein